MTDFLDQLEADLRVAAERRGQPRRRRRRPTGALKAVAVLAALALLVVGAARAVNDDAAEQTATPSPSPTSTPGPRNGIAVATAGDPALLDLLSAPLEATFGPPDPSGEPRTADPSLGTVVLYRSGGEPPSDPALGRSRGEETARFVAYTQKIDRVEPLTRADEDRIHFSVADADVVVVYGTERQERMLRDPQICRSAGSVAGGPVTLCVARADEARYSSFVVDGRPVRVDPISENGWWSWAAAAPDGRTILAEWTSYTSYIQATGGCSVPQSALIPADGGQPQPVTTGPAVPLGWTTDGRAIVFRPAATGCGDGDPGLYLVTPEGEATLLAPAGGTKPPLEPSVEPRTVEEVTRAAG